MRTLLFFALPVLVVLSLLWLFGDRNWIDYMRSAVTVFAVQGHLYAARNWLTERERYAAVCRQYTEPGHELVRMTARGAKEDQFRIATVLAFLTLYAVYTWLIILSLGGQTPLGAMALIPILPAVGILAWMSYQQSRRSNQQDVLATARLREALKS